MLEANILEFRVLPDGIDHKGAGPARQSKDLIGSHPTQELRNVLGSSHASSRLSDGQFDRNPQLCRS